MVFKVQASDKACFEFQVPGDETVYSVPMMQHLDGKTVERIAELEREGSAAGIAAEYLVFGEPGTPSGDAVRTLDYPELQQLNRAYREASRIAVGESSASTDS